MRTSKILTLLVLGIATTYASLDTSTLDKATVNAANEQSSLPSHRRSLQQTTLPLVVNGWEADPNQFPYTGSLLTNQLCDDTLTPTSSSNTPAPSSSTERSVGFCASNLIMPRVLVTSGHCLKKCSSTAAPDSLPGEEPNPYTEVTTWSAPMTVKLNQTNITEPTSAVPGAEERTMSGVARQPEYATVNNLPVDNDIAILWFDEPSQITPVQIASKTTFELGQEFMVAGWGYTDPSNFSISDTLQTTVVPFVPYPTCKAKYNSLKDPVPVSRGDICAGSDPETYADSCAGDSGGPLLMNVTTILNKAGTNCRDQKKINEVNKYEQQLVGLTSYGESCANDFPGVYTNVPKQADWLDQTITLSNAGGLETPAIGCSHHVGQRYYGKAKTTLWRIPNAAQCCNACKVRGTDKCRSWAWHSKTNRCQLIKEVEKRALTSTWTSGNTTGTLPPKSSTCELEFYVKYGDPGRSQRVKKITRGPASESAEQCCAACQRASACGIMSYNTVFKTCTLYKGPDRKKGWARRAWEYNYVSGLVSRG